MVDDDLSIPMKLIIGFAVGSVLAALFRTGFWTAILCGIAGAIVAYFAWSRINV